MLNYFNTAIALAEPYLVDAAVTEVNQIAKEIGIDETVADVTAVVARLNYRLEEFVAVGLGKENAATTANAIEGYLGDNYEQPTLFSSAAGSILSVGSYYLSGGGIVGSAVSGAVGRVIEPVARKMQYVNDEQHYENLDEQQDLDGQAQYAAYGYSAPGF